MGGQCTYCSSYICQAVWVVSVHLHLHLGFVHPLQDVALHQCLPSSSVCCFPNPGGSLLLCYVILPSSAWSSSRTYCSSYVCQAIWVVSVHTVLHMSVKLYGWSVHILFFICLSSYMGGQCTYCSSYVCQAVWVVSVHTVLHMSVKLYGWSVYIMFFICLSSCMGGQCTYCSSYVYQAVWVVSVHTVLHMSVKLSFM